MKTPTYFSLLWFLSCLLSCQTNPPQAPPKRPNILLIMADDVGYSDIGCYGGEIRTPNLDRLAANGLRFTQFYNTSRCCPTRASLMTGLYPHQAGIGHMMNPKEGFESYAGNLSKKAVTIAEALRPAGYRTYMSGKWHLTPGHDEERLSNRDNWPLKRGFDRFFGTIHGAGSFYDPNSLTSGDSLIVPSEGFYYTDAISDTMVKFVEQHEGDTPFFGYLAYTAAHWPMHALPGDIAKYKGAYDQGWDAVRAARYARMLEMGLIDPKWAMSEAYPEGQDWDSTDRKAWHAQCMEVYAAMLDNMDRGIGRILAALEAKGELENTLVIYLQDNGACAETYGFRAQIEQAAGGLQPMQPGELQYDMRPSHTRDGKPIRIGMGVVPGPPDTYIGYDKRWANASNTPFRMFKHWSHEGGISSPLIVHWPKGFGAKNEFRPQPTHLIDIMATCVDVAGASYPATHAGQAITPMEGLSLRPAFDSNTQLDRETLYWEHEGNRAIRTGDWKLVSKAVNNPHTYEKTNEIPLEDWELYHLGEDRTEVNNLAAEQPERVAAMAADWFAWATRVHAVPKPQ